MCQPGCWPQWTWSLSEGLGEVDNCFILVHSGHEPSEKGAKQAGQSLIKWLYSKNTFSQSKLHKQESLENQLLEVKYQEQEQTDTAKRMFLKARPGVATQSSLCNISGCHLCLCMHKITSESAITPYSNGFSSLPSCFFLPVHTA